MDQISCHVQDTDEGIVVITSDSHQDVLAGPFENYADAFRAAHDLGLTLPAVTPTKKRLRVGDMHPGDLFRIAGFWYRLITPDRKTATVDQIAGPHGLQMAAKTEITEVSVLSTR